MWTVENYTPFVNNLYSVVKKFRGDIEQLTFYQMDRITGKAKVNRSIVNRDLPVKQNFTRQVWSFQFVLIEITDRSKAIAFVLLIYFWY